MSSALGKPRSADKEFVYLKPLEIAIEDDFNVRLELPKVEEMMHSILEEGLQTPLHVRNDNGVYVLEAGHRRLAAIKLAIERKIDSPHLSPIPCRIVKRFSTEPERLMLQLVRNQAEPLTIWEQAIAVQKLKAFSIPDQEIQQRWGISAQHYSNLIAINEAPQQLVDLVTQKRISPSTAIDALARFGSEELKDALDKAIATAGAEGAPMIKPRHFPGKVLRATKKAAVKDQHITGLLNACDERLKACKTRKERSYVKMLVGLLKGRCDIDTFLKTFANGSNETKRRVPV